MPRLFILVLMVIIISSCKQDHSIPVFAGLKIATPLKDFRQSTYTSKFTQYRGLAYYTFTTNNGKKFYGVPCTRTFDDNDSTVCMMSIYISQSVDFLPDLVKEMHHEKRLASTLLNNPNDGIASEREIYEYLKESFESKYKKPIGDSKQYDDHFKMMQYQSFFKPSNDYFIRIERYVDETLQLDDSLNPAGCIVITYTVEGDYLEKHGLSGKEAPKQSDF